MSARTIKAIQRQTYTTGIFHDVQVDIGEVVEEVTTNAVRNVARLYDSNNWCVCDVSVTPGDVVVKHTPIGGYSRIVSVFP